MAQSFRSLLAKCQTSYCACVKCVFHLWLVTISACFWSLISISNIILKVHSIVAIVALPSFCSWMKPVSSEDSIWKLNRLDGEYTPHIYTHIHTHHVEHRQTLWSKLRNNAVYHWRKSLSLIPPAKTIYWFSPFFEDTLYHVSYLLIWKCFPLTYRLNPDLFLNIEYHC